MNEHRVYFFNDEGKLETRLMSPGFCRMLQGDAEYKFGKVAWIVTSQAAINENVPVSPTYR